MFWKEPSVWASSIGLLFFALGHRVNTICQELPRFCVSLPCLCERNVRVFAEGHELLLAIESILPTPKLPSGWGHAEEHPVRRL